MTDLGHTRAHCPPGLYRRCQGDTSKRAHPKRLFFVSRNDTHSLSLCSPPLQLTNAAQSRKSSFRLEELFLASTPSTTPLCHPLYNIQMSPNLGPDMAPPASDQRDSLLLSKLPSEIRNTIYGFIFEHGEPIYTAPSRWYQGRFKVHRRLGDGNCGLVCPGMC